jgi:hypothetical protein
MYHIVLRIYYLGQHSIISSTAGLRLNKSSGCGKKLALSQAGFEKAVITSIFIPLRVYNCAFYKVLFWVI